MVFSEKSEIKYKNNIRTLELNNLKIACEEMKLKVTNLQSKVEQSKYNLFPFFSGEEQEIIENELSTRFRKQSLNERNRLNNKLRLIEVKTTPSTQPRDSESDNSELNENNRPKKKTRRFIKRSKYRRIMRKLSRKPLESLFINYSSHIITDAEKKLLNKHLNFVPIPDKINKTQLEYDMARFKRTLRWKEHFADKDNQQEPSEIIFPVIKHSLPKAPPSRTLNQFTYGIESDIFNFDINIKKYNLTNSEKEAMQTLISKQKLGEIVLQKTDKGGAVALMDREDYINNIETEHLNSKVTKSDGSVVSVYRSVPEVMVMAQHDNIKNAAMEAANNGTISYGTAKQMVPLEPCAARAYGMPKAHKDTPEGKTLPPLRLVISGCGSSTEMASHFVDFYCKQIPPQLPSYIQDTPHLLRMIKDINSQGLQPEEAILVTIDVVGLYPNIPQDEGLKAFEEYISDKKYRDQNMPSSFLITLLKFVLQYNTFIFNNKWFTQQFGTAIGTKVAPTYANLFMGKLEKSILEGWIGRNPDLWKRYIDDIISIWSGTEQELLNFLEYMNSIHHSIKFTAEFRNRTHQVKTKWTDKFTIERKPLGDKKPRSVDFLDSTIYIDEAGKLQTDLFVKSTDVNTLLMPTSCHPSHIYKNIPFSAGLRAKRLCSIPDSLTLRLSELSDSLLIRGYNKKVIKSAFDRVNLINRDEALKKVTKTQNSNRVSCAITFDPRLPDPAKIMKRHYNLAVKNPSFKSTFSDIPRICYKRSKNLGEMLIRSKLYTVETDAHNLRPKLGFIKCSYNTHGCCLCKYNNNATTHTSLNTGKVHQVKKLIKCSDTFIIYTIQCKRCPTIEYVGKTTQPIAKRFYQHYSGIIKKETIDPVPEHFNTRGHSVSDIIMIPFEKCKKDDTLLTIRENIWISEKDSVLKGLNRI